MVMKYNLASVSIPDKKLEAAARAKAKAQRRSFSNYICCLIEADLKANSSPENISAGTDVKMPADLAVFVPVIPPPVSKTPPKRRR